MNLNLRLAALEIVAERGLLNLTRADLCKLAGIPDGSFQLYAGYTFGEFVEKLAATNPTQPDVVAIKRARVCPALIRCEILRVFNRLADSKDPEEIKRSEVAEAMGVPPRTISRAFRSMQRLRAERRKC